MRYLHVWGCQAEIRIYNLQERKLDARTISGYFIGYPEKLKGYMFYCSNHSMRIVKNGNARLIGNDEISGRLVLLFDIVTFASHRCPVWIIFSISRRI